MSATIIVLPCVRGDEGPPQGIDAREALALSLRALHPDISIAAANMWTGRMIVELARLGFAVAPFERIGDGPA